MNFKKALYFDNLILGDEINRSPAKVQAALLEAMAERQITVGQATYPLPKLFMVMATQNPIEQEGTYPLPEAQLDRFLLHVKVDYPKAEHEKSILHLARSEARSESLKITRNSNRSVKAPCSTRAMKCWICIWRKALKIIYCKSYWRP